MSCCCVCSSTCKKEEAKSGERRDERERGQGPFVADPGVTEGRLPLPVDERERDEGQMDWKESEREVDGKVGGVADCGSRGRRLTACVCRAAS